MASYKNNRKFRALIVEDSTDFRALAVRALDRVNVVCTEAADGLAADEALRHSRFDVVICDLRMPRKHGHQLVVELLDQDDPPCIIVVTGIVEPRITGDLIKRGVADVLTKPLDFPYMAAKVRALLERREEQESTKTVAGATDITKQITTATSALRAELNTISQSFEETIAQLERQRNELEGGFIGSIRVFTSLIERLKQSHGSHAGRVAEMAVWIAKRAGLNTTRIRNIEYASLLHELGQFGMPDSIRVKPPWSLSEDELRIFRQYPTIGAALLSEVQGLGPVVDLIEQHAENFDGSGFPSGKRAKAIATGARIIRIADGCDTILMHATGDQPLEACREYLAKHKGTYFDPELTGYAGKFLQEQKHSQSELQTELLALEDVTPGAELADDVYDENGHFLVRKGAVMSAAVLGRLKNLMPGGKVSVITPDAPAE